MINDIFLLFIEPKNPPSESPLIDDLTRKMVVALRQKGSSGHATEHGEFLKGLSTRGFYICSCGAVGSSVDYKIPGGEVTNVLASHYLAWHRDEITEEQLDRVRRLPIKVEDEQTSIDGEIRYPKGK